MSERSSTPVVILGAGLTGLSAAHHLELPYRLLERAGQVGGLCVTDDDEGYRFDRTGHLLHLRDSATKEWVFSLLDEEPLRIRRKSRIWSHGTYTRYPFQTNTHGLPHQVARECLLGFLRARDAERDAQSGEQTADDEALSFEEFILKYMGSGIAKHFMVPYNTKLWGVPPGEMSSAWTDRFVPRPRLDEVISGAIGGAEERAVGYNAEFYYPRLGIGELTTALARKVASRVELETSVRAIDIAQRRLELTTGETVVYEHLISTIPLDVLMSLIVDPPPVLSAAAGLLRCTALRYLDVALLRPAGRDLHWAYVPEERYPFYRVGAYSNFSDALVPPGCGSLYVELASRQPVDLEAVMPTVIDGLTEMGLIDDAGQIAFVRPRYIEHAYVIYDHSYRQALDGIHPFLRQNGIYSCGRYGSWEYSAMEDALMSGRDAARRIQEES